MVQLVVKRASWWEFNTKQVMVWVPVATLQMGTLAGLGYFYHRLSDLEAQTSSFSSMGASVGQTVRTALREEDKPQTVLVSERILPKPAPVSLQVTLDRPEVLGTMSAGEGFFTPLSASANPVENITPVASSINLPVGGVSAKPVLASSSGQAKQAPDARPQRIARQKRAERSVTKPVATSRPPSSVPEAISFTYEDVDTARTAAANRAGLYEADAEFQIPELGLEEVFAPETPVIVDPVPVDPPVPVPSGSKKPLPVGTVAWVYLGELRDYGWHGQRLHVAPDSGLPEVGNSYHTQELHGIYDRPHGSRAMGGFQQGDRVTILEVQHESNNGVWAKVRKAQSVGRVNR